MRHLPKQRSELSLFADVPMTFDGTQTPTSLASVSLYVYSIEYKPMARLWDLSQPRKAMHTFGEC